MRRRSGAIRRGSRAATVRKGKVPAGAAAAATADGVQAAPSAAMSGCSGAFRSASSAAARNLRGGEKGARVRVRGLAAALSLFLLRLFSALAVRRRATHRAATVRRVLRSRA